MALKFNYLKSFGKLFHFKHAPKVFVHIFMIEADHLKMKYFIITGAGSGLGEALAKQVIEEHHKVFCISRKINEKLKELASLHKTGFWYFEIDLTDSEKITSLMKEIFTYIDQDNAIEITLINNAGIVEPVKPLGTSNADEINEHIKINFTAPVILSNDFIRESERFNCKKNIVMISSGAASNPYYGWALYCSTKAALEMVTRTVALEQKDKAYPVKIFAIAPGILDTKMQEKLRNSDLSDFPMRPKFEKLFDQGKLTPPEDAASGIFEMLKVDLLPNGSITDLRNAAG
jgi:benzil reductase ((S)-benzoin forming)